MPPLVQAFTAAVVFLVLHISVMALCAWGMGVRIRQVRYGIGPCLFSVGKVRIHLLPLSGSVKLKDSREELLEPDDVADAFNHQPAWKQVLLPLSGAVAMLSIAISILGAEGWHSFVSAFPQIVEGALGPFSSARISFDRFSAFATGHSFAAVFALVAAKLAAFNLLPFGGFNGGLALINLLKQGQPDVKWEAPVTRWLLIPALLVFAGWLVALMAYALP